MVREQEPAKLPPHPAKANIQPQPKPAERDLNFVSGNAAAAPRVPQIPNTAPTQVQFGISSLPGASQPYSRPQPPQVSANAAAQRQVSGARQDPAYSNLFISSKNHQRSELHKPPRQANPLYQLKDTASHVIKKTTDKLSEHNPFPASGTHTLFQDQNARPTVQSRQSRPESDFVEISRPSNVPAWAPKPPPPPTFSSSAYSNPYYQNSNFLDLTAMTIGMSTNRDLFDDRYGASDPLTYLDSAKANENIKALLEGALEDEDDKPRTRRRRKQLEQESESLAEKMKSMNVKEESPEADEEDEEYEDDGTVEGLKVKLLPHQIEGVAWMQDKELGTKKTRGVLPKGGILADDMGLGKTIQSIALMLMNPKPSAAELKTSKRKLPEDLDKGTLVIAPLALIKQWEGEIRDRIEDTHTMRVLVHHGPQRTKNYKDLKKYDVVITTYQTLSSEFASSEGKLMVGCFGLNWYRIILDEAHSIKNRNAKATKAACGLRAEYRWCLTGTPMQNNLDELQSLIHFLRIKPYEDLNAWRDQITRPMNNGRGGLAIKRLQVYLKAFMKRRTKDILKQDGALKNGSDSKDSEGKSTGFKIVERLVEPIEADFTPEERNFYQRLETRADERLEQMMAGNKLSYANALVLLLRLRQACNHPKLIGGSLAKEKDAFTNGSGSQTPSRSKASTEDLDSLTDMLGSLSVASKKCDVCLADLMREEASAGAIRCEVCQAQVDELEGATVTETKVKKERKTKHGKQATARKKQNRRVVADSDEEEGEEEDSSESEDDDVKPVRRQKKGILNLVSDNEEEEDSSEDDIYSDEDTQNPPGAAASLVSSTKIRHLLSLLRADAHTHKYIVFSFFTSMLDVIEPFLRTHLPKLRYARYDGAMRPDAREAALNQLRSNPKCRILLCSLRAGSLGLNLTAASRVVILEPFWNPFVEEQAIDRVHRLNQTQDVKIFKLTVRDTVESRILELQERKRELAAQTIEGKMGAGKLTLQDMLKLFRREAEGEHAVDGVGMVERGALLREGEGMVGQGQGQGQGQLRMVEKKREHEVYGRRW